MSGRSVIEISPDPCRDMGEVAGPGFDRGYAPSFVPPGPAQLSQAPRGQSARRKVVERTIHERVIEDQADSHAEDVGRAPWLQVVLALCAIFALFVVCSAVVSVLGHPGAGGDFVVLIALASAGGGMMVLKGLQVVRGR